MTHRGKGLARGALFAGRYRLERLLRQSSRRTWEARDEEEDREVVVEVLHPDLTRGSARERFFREGNAVERIASRHVAEVLDRGVDDDWPYLVFPRYAGESLGERLTAKTPLDVSEVAEIVRQCAAGLEAAHEAGVVHRDIEPANLLLVPDRRGVVVKIRNFGLAKVEERDRTRRLTRPGELIGAPPYVSPERVRARPPRPTDDLWSLAVVAYQALTRRVPFQGETFGATYVAVMEGEFRPPSELRPELPKDTDAFFRQAFSNAPEGRFIDAAALSGAFRRSLGLDSVDLARARERLGKRVARGSNSEPPSRPVEPPAARRHVAMLLVVTHAAALALGVALATWM